ncbi:hypothetical protein E5673_08985 [Sphingomonas sp. PAMC26645]|uniref:hypothetical protein n=1 Tax=Sphingomonas sp. PAMC26645 TaxID=2565555 RepID=UPI00109DC3E1|nr:hypothetical protein [Sphingomonas sp. PAMC26645]QCB42349.1 hypothetical protein E5673_08985 [Sphingomonas sp. PAMC26645]
MPATTKPYANFPLEKIEAVKRLAREGFSVREICRRVGTHHHNVRPIVAELDASKELPTHCPCGQLRGVGHRNLVCAVSTARKTGYPKRRASQLGWPKIKDIYRRIDAGQSNRSIALETGISLTAVNRHSKAWMKKRERPFPPCRCGRPARHPGGCIVNSPSLIGINKRQQIKDWVARGFSAAQMVRSSRKAASIHTILKYATPLWEKMAVDGTFCGCGERRGHRGVCIATWESDLRIRGPQPMPREEQDRILNALLNGDSIITVRRNVPTSEKRAYRVLRAMSPAERHRRACIVYRRIRDDDGAVHGRNLFEKVQAAVPAGIVSSVRDEVVSELSLAVLQGDLTLDQIRAHAKKYVGRAFQSWASGFGPKSLDEALGDDGSRTLGDFVGDSTGSLSVDEIEIGGRE